MWLQYGYMCIDVVGTMLLITQDDLMCFDVHGMHFH